MENFANDIVSDVQKKISDGADELVGNALNNIAKYLPTDSEKENFLARIHEIKAEGIEAALNGEDYRQYLNRGAYETSVFLANHYAKEILERAKNKFPRGKTRDAIFSALQEMSRRGIEGLCGGESLEVVKNQLANIGREHFKKYVENQSKIWSKNFGNSLYRKIKFSGRGSRKKNQYLRKGRDIFADELAFQITDNFGAWLGGEKNFGDAVTDITVNTAKNSAVTYGKKYGEELARDAIKELSKVAEKKIANETARKVAVTNLNKLAKSDIVGFAGMAYDVGRALKQLIDGEISKTEFLRVVGEKGSSIVVGGVYGTVGGMIGMAVGGPLGAAIGSAVGSAIGYFATSVLFGSVMQAFEEAELSRQRYEAIHEFCEYSIREMERQRLQFEQDVAQFLSHRQQVIDTNLTAYEEAIKNNDFDRVSSALNGISEEFGGSLQFKTFNEFDDFMSDKNSVFEL